VVVVVVVVIVVVVVVVVVAVEHGPQTGCGHLRLLGDLVRVRVRVSSQWEGLGLDS
jgi:hypothetical protein